MKNETMNLLVQQVYRQGIRRVFLINLSNNIILFSIFAIFIFDFLMIINVMNSEFDSKILFILVLMIPFFAFLKTYKELPSKYKILATVDHLGATRGTFSLLNEISKKETENTNLEVLFEKSQKLIQSLSFKKIFPWKLLWNGYFGAALAFTAVLWIAIPQSKKSDQSQIIQEQDSTVKDFSVKKTDTLISTFINKNKTAPSTESDSPQSNEKKAFEQKGTKGEKELVAILDTTDQLKTEKKSENHQQKEDEKNDSNNSKKNGGNGSGSEEAHSDKTTEIKDKSLQATSNDQKIKIDVTKNQDGSSERISNNASTTKPSAEEKLKNTEKIKMQNIENISELVSSKYQKIIENYFSNEE